LINFNEKSENPQYALYQNKNQVSEVEPHPMLAFLRRVKVFKERLGECSIPPKKKYSFKNIPEPRPLS
jgi:hypothetical protein